MHDQARGEPGLRERRAANTAAQIIDLARHWVIERGLNGFTVDELCDEVGISRRTFFNYFAKKEFAVLGVRRKDAAHDAAVARFLDSTVPLPEALAELAIDRWESLGLSRTEHARFPEMLEREPQLFTHLSEFAAMLEHDDIALAAQRDGLEPTNHRIVVVVQTLDALVRASAREFAETDTATDFGTIMRARVATLRDAFTTQ